MENKAIIFSLLALAIFLLWKNDQQHKDIEYLRETIFMQNEAITSQQKLLALYKFYYTDNNPISYQNNDIKRTH
tara:strand:+ start:4005 stop:4226 length:222 start_codon:yes stop_codon:yes gene_type:complete